MTDGGSSIPEVQALLAALTAAKPYGRIAEGDPVREAFLRDARLCSVELLARADMAVIIATRRA